MDVLGRQATGPLPRASRDAEIGSHVLAALEARAPVTVLRGPRGYGKTTAIVRWLERRWDDLPTAYIPLGAESRTAEGFWQAIRTGLIAAGCTDEVEPTGNPQVDTTTVLDKHDEPWRLVIDNYYESGLSDDNAGQIDEDILEMVRANRQLELVVATRGLRALETIGALSVDITVVRPADLALRPEGLVAIGKRRGLEMTLDHAQNLVTELGGWPAALRSCVDVAAVGDREAVVDATMVDGFIDTLLRDLRSDELREFLMRTAVPDEFSVAATRALVRDGSAARQLRNLRVSGLIRERETVDGLRFSYPPAIRESIVRSIAEHRPEIIGEVHHDLLTLAAEVDGPIGVLRHAVDAADWDTALTVLEEEWSTLIMRHPRTLDILARQFPRQLAAKDPRVRVIRSHLPRMMSGQNNDHTHWQPATPTFVDAAMEQRWREHGGTADDALVLLTTGVAAIFSGENDAAASAFERARNLEASQDDRTTRLLALVGLLGANALAGEADLALKLLDDELIAPILAGEGNDDVSNLVRVGGSIFRAIAATDAMMPDVHQAIAAMMEPTRRDELWALAVSTRGIHAAVHGGQEDQARAIGELRAALRHQNPGSITESTLITQLAELLIVSDMPDVAEQVISRLPDSFVTSPTRAFVLYAQGRHREAIDVAEKGTTDPRITARSHQLALVVIAASLYRLGQLTAARLRFARAVQLSHETGQRRAFGLIEADVFAALVGDNVDPSKLKPSAKPSKRSQLTATGPGAPSGTLSARELEVLRTLHEHTGPAGVAQDLGMSVNTAKTHLRHVYRKLGASSRDEALELSRGLLSFGQP